MRNLPVCGVSTLIKKRYSVVVIIIHAIIKAYQATIPIGTLSFLHHHIVQLTACDQVEFHIYTVVLVLRGGIKENHSTTVPGGTTVTEIQRAGESAPLCSTVCGEVAFLKTEGEKFNFALMWGKPPIWPRTFFMVNFLQSKNGGA